MRGLHAFVGLLACVSGAALLGCGGQPGPPLASPPEPGEVAVGFNDDVDEETFAQQGQTGMPITRFSVPWDQVELSPGSRDWSKFDRRYAAMLEEDLEPLLLAIGAPCWTRPGRPCAPGPPDAAFDPNWAEYVRGLVERYPDAVGVEVWNEPNIVPLWPPFPDPARYAALLGAAYGAVNSVDPEMPVVSGGLFAGEGSGSFGLADREFLGAALAAGAGASIDAIGVHPYPIAPGAAGAGPQYDVDGMGEALDRVRSVRDAAGLSETPLWITEMGVSTASAAGFPVGATEPAQAQLVLESLREADRAGDVDVALIHRLTDRPFAGTDPLGQIEAGFGVFAMDGRPKRVACALSERFGGALSC